MQMKKHYIKPQTCEMSHLPVSMLCASEQFMGIGTEEEGEAGSRRQRNMQTPSVPGAPATSPTEGTTNGSDLFGPVTF